MTKIKVKNIANSMKKNKKNKKFLEKGRLNSIPANRGHPPYFIGDIVYKMLILSVLHFLCFLPILEKSTVSHTKRANFQRVTKYFYFLYFCALLRAVVKHTTLTP